MSKKLSIKIKISTLLGVTLIEVLIALMIISIALTAVIKSTGENIQASAHLKDKTAAMWVAKDIMNQITLGLLSFTSTTDKMSSELKMLNRSWWWEAQQKSTPNSNIKKVIITVYKDENAKNHQQTTLTWEGYVANKTISN